PLPPYLASSTRWALSTRATAMIVDSDGTRDIAPAERSSSTSTIAPPPGCGRIRSILWTLAHTLPSVAFRRGAADRALRRLGPLACPPRLVRARELEVRRSLGQLARLEPQPLEESLPTGLRVIHERW